MHQKLPHLNNCLRRRCFVIGSLFKANTTCLIALDGLGLHNTHNFNFGYISYCLWFFSLFLMLNASHDNSIFTADFIKKP